MKRRALFAGIWVLIPLLAARACGPDFSPDVFVRKLRPDLPKEFAKGKLGVLLPTFPRADLTVAFRYLNGGSLSKSEQAAYQPIYPREEWNDEAAELPNAKDSDNASDPAQSWLLARTRYAASAPHLNVNRDIEVKTPNGYTWNSKFENCNQDAVRTAVKTIQSRAKTWGDKSPDLLDWIHGQDAVFANCDAKVPVLPLPASSGGSPLLKADRAYQIAAAQFYASQYDAARKGFEDIAQDSNSPWRGIARYLVARCLIRQAFFAGPIQDANSMASFDPVLMRQATTVLRRVLKENLPGISRKAVENELNFALLRVEPEERLKELASLLAGPSTDGNYDQDLTDFTWLLDEKLDNVPVREDADEEKFLSPEEQERGVTVKPDAKSAAFSSEYAKLASIRASTPLVDWLITFQSPAKQATTHAAERWRSTHQLWWLVAAIAKATEKDAAAVDLIKAADQVDSTSPAWETLTYHRVRLLIALDQSEQARVLLDRVMPLIHEGGRDSSVNAYIGLRMRSAANLDQFLLYAPRKILYRVSESQASLDECMDVMKDPNRKYDCKPDKDPMQLSADAARVLNTQTPLTTLSDIAASHVLPEPLRRAVVQMAWVRSVLLKDDVVAARLFLLLPEKLQQQSGGGTGFRSLVTLVRNPGLRPFLEGGVQRSYSYDFVESYSDNWWCPDWQASTYRAFGKDEIPRSSEPVAFLTAAQKLEASREMDSIAHQGGAQTYLGGLVLAYANDHPKDADVPESLYLVLRMIRYGCERGSWPETSASMEIASKQELVQRRASRLLRQRYPTSQWTKKAAPIAR